MERVIGWVDANGGQGWRATPGAQDRFSRSEGLTLRPTGMVVFATMESANAGPAIGRTGAAPTWAGIESLAVGEGVGYRPRSSTPARTQQWRRRASRGAAWLLGR